MRRLLLIACVALSACSTKQPPKPSTLPTSDITVKTGELRTIPKLEAGATSRVTDELNAAIGQVYSRAFFAKPNLLEMFTPDAASTLSAVPAAFQPDAPATRGTVRWSGIGTASGGDVTTAWLSVRFSGFSASERLSQSGGMLLVRTPQGWRVGGYDVSLAVQNEAGSPVPVAARYMP